MRNPKFIILLFLSVLFAQQTLSQTRTNTSLAFAYYNDSEWEKAAPLFLEIYESNQAKPYLTYYTRCLVELKQYDDALKALKKAYRATKDVTLYIDQAYLYELSNDRKKAEEYFEKPFREFPQDVNAIKNLGNAYISYQKLDEAARVFEIGRSLLKQPDEFRMEMATLFRLQNRFDEMLDEYLSLLLVQPRQIRAVENYLYAALSADIDKTLLEITESKTKEYIQDFPGYDVYLEVLVWVYTQQKRYDLAVDQAIALDIRNHDSGDRTLRLARRARMDGDYPAAIRAYEFITHPESQFQNTNNRSVNSQRSIMQAMLELNQTKLEQVSSKPDSQKSDFQQVFDSFEQSLDQVSDPLQKAYFFKDMASIKVFHLDEPNTGLALIDSAINYSGRNPQIRSDCMIDKADYLMLANDPWQATLLYARVDKENKDLPAGSIAKLKKAQSAFYTEDFDWALSQLNVLKGSTSKLIANDAFELALLIKENSSKKDSLRTGLKNLARAKYLIFQKREDDCLEFLDSISQQTENNIILDDAVFMKAEILADKGLNEKAIAQYQRVVTDFRDGIWGHKALFRLGELYLRMGQTAEAQKAFMTLITDFPNSFYNLDARNYLREIKAKDQQSETTE